MFFYVKFILIFFIAGFNLLFLPSISFANSNNNDIFLEEVKNKRDSNYRNLELNFFLLKSVQDSSNLISLQINPFYNLQYLIRNLEIRVNYSDYSNDSYYDKSSSNHNYELDLVYNIVNLEVLTLYINYGIYSMYNRKLYDFELEKERSVAYKRSYGIGGSANIYKNIYLSFEKRWIHLNDDYLKNINDFYLGLRLKIPLKILKEV